jgi:hypothetical protein
VKHSLDALCSRFGVDRSIRIKHGALIDAQLLAEVYVELPAGGRSGWPGGGGEEADGKIDVLLVDRPPASMLVRPARPHAPTQDELARHAVLHRFHSGLDLEPDRGRQLTACLRGSSRSPRSGALQREVGKSVDRPRRRRVATGRDSTVSCGRGGRLPPAVIFRTAVSFNPAWATAMTDLPISSPHKASMRV